MVAIVSATWLALVPPGLTPSLQPATELAIPDAGSEPIADECFERDPTLRGGLAWIGEHLDGGGRMTLPPSWRVELGLLLREVPLRFKDVCSTLDCLFSFHAALYCSIT